MRTCEGLKKPYNDKHRERSGTLNPQYGGTNLWHFLISLDGARRTIRLPPLLAVLLAAQPISRRKSPLIAVLPAGPVTSPPGLPLPAVRPISRKKSLPPAVPLAALAISNLFYLHHTRSRREAACREHTKSYSVHPIYYKSEVKDDETVFFLSMAHHRCM